jgi:hypothetical protein
MSDYSIRFIGHIDETRRPIRFPKEIYFDLYVRAENSQALKAAINAQAQVFINENCMIVPKNPSALESFSNPATDSRMIVGWHMITHITTETKRIVGEIPQLSQDNRVLYTDGTKPSIQ